ncbi:dGTPase [Idiomarina sp. HB]|uniref:dGTPase n=1 Tax=Idiomarina sp. HB TaxID=3110479 RepID=UPI003A80B4E7
MDLSKIEALITDERFFPRKRGNLVIAAESDRGRIINSAAIRRLQQKTQVFPLERNAAVRSRLTHSLEVQQNGRFIVREIEKRFDENLKKQKKPKPEENWKLFRAMESIVEMACLMHDIGNPPFGHFGESAISGWFGDNLEGIFKNIKTEQTDITEQELMQELKNFEGNAQAIRLIHSLMTLNLTYTQIAAVLKYTREGTKTKPHDQHPLSYLQKKPGYYWAEAEIVEKIYKALGMTPGHRHPLSYIMEAADDIAYGLADLEDAVEKDVLSVEAVISGIQKEYGKERLRQETLVGVSGKKQSLQDILSYAEKGYARNSIDSNNQFFISLRVSVHNVLVAHAAERFFDNYDAIVMGNFNDPLLEDDSDAHRLSEALQTLAGKYVFSHPEVEQQELRGHTIITGLLQAYSPLLRLPQTDFWEISENTREFCRKHPLCSRLFNKLSNKHVRAYKSAVRDYKHDMMLERYFRCRLLQDYISGMTDQFAYDEYRSLKVSD